MNETEKENIAEPNKYHYRDANLEIYAVEGEAMRVDTDPFGGGAHLAMGSYEEVSEFMEKVEHARRVAFPESHIESLLKQVDQAIKDWACASGYTDKVLEVVEQILRKEIEGK